MFCASKDDTVGPAQGLRVNRRVTGTPTNYDQNGRFTPQVYTTTGTVWMCRVVVVLTPSADSEGWGSRVGSDGDEKTVGL